MGTRLVHAHFELPSIVSETERELLEKKLNTLKREYEEGSLTCIHTYM